MCLNYGKIKNGQRNWQIAIIELLNKCKKYIDKKYNPDGYNVGLNCGESAGQSVMHIHMHLVPRYKGDVDDPCGGVRGVIPNKKIIKEN